MRLAPKAPLLADVSAIFVQHLHYRFLFVAFLMMKRCLGEETAEFPKLFSPFINVFFYFCFIHLQVSNMSR